MSDTTPDKPVEKVFTDAEVAEELKKLPGWELKDGWIRRKYKTGGWPMTLMAVNAVGFLAEAAFHHPDLAVSWAEVTVKLKTHSAGGITAKDFELAARIDAALTWAPPEGSALEGYEKGMKKKWVR